MQKRKNRLTLLALFGALLVLMLLSFSFGRYEVPLPQVCRILLSKLFPMEKTWTAPMESAVLHIRLPRILMACMVGCSLSAAGASYQGIFQNPMAAPDILGASSGAALGAAIAIVCGLSAYGVTLLAFAFSLGTVLLAFLLARYAKGSRVVALVLAGIIVSSLLNAGTSYVKLVADPNSQLPAITYWLMGSLNNTNLREVAQTFPIIFIGLAVLFCLRWRMNLLTVGDDEARTLGVHTGRLRLAVILCATLITAASISVSGMIGWIGLVIPHMCRKLVGSNFKVLLPASMLGGAVFLLLVDDICRNLMQSELPIGILTAVVGAPFFLYLMLRREKEDAACQ